MDYCNHGQSIYNHCFKCHEEREKKSYFGIKAGIHEKLSDLPILKIFKTKKAAENYCKKNNEKNSKVYFTYILISKDKQ